jgi:D-hydroxyproline dehydrogenase subunit gamma
MAVAARIATGVTRGTRFTFEADGETVVAFEGETIATALLVAGKSALRRTARQDAPRGIFCGMGMCFDCVMTVNGVPNVRACVTRAEPGMRVETQREAGWDGR